MLYRAGVKINVIQARLGHSRWQTTADWYIENHAEGERAAADVASKLLDGWERKEEVSVAKCCRNVAVRLDRRSQVCKLLKQNNGEVAEWLKAAVC